MVKIRRKRPIRQCKREGERGRGRERERERERERANRPFPLFSYHSFTLSPEQRVGKRTHSPPKPRESGSETRRLGTSTGGEKWKGVGEEDRGRGQGTGTGDGSLGVVD